MIAMDCDSASERLSARLDAALSAGEAAELDHHLAACPACTRRFLLIEDTRRLFRALPPEPVSPDLEARVLHRLRSRGGRSWVLAVVGIAAVLAVVMLRGVTRVHAPGVPVRSASEPVHRAPAGVTAGLTLDPAAGLDCGRPAGVCEVQVPCRQGECGPATP